MLYTSRDVTIAFFACNILATNVGWAPASNMPCATDASSSSGLLQKKYTQWHYITPHVLVLVNMAGGEIYGSVEDLRLVYEMQGVKIGFCLERLILGPKVFISRLFTLCPSPSHFVCGPQTSCLHSCKLRQNLVRKCNYEQNQQVQQWTKTKMNYVTTVGLFCVMHLFWDISQAVPELKIITLFSAYINSFVTFIRLPVNETNSWRLH